MGTLQIHLNVPECRRCQVHLLPLCVCKHPVSQRMCTECRHGPQSQSADVKVSSSDFFTARYWFCCITLLSGEQLCSARVTSDLVFLQELCGEGPRGIAQHLINIAAVPESVVAFVFCHHRVALKLVGEFITAHWLKTSRQEGCEKNNSEGFSLWQHDVCLSQCNSFCFKILYFYTR